MVLTHIYFSLSVNHLLYIFYHYYIIVYISGDTAMAEFLESLFLALERQLDTFTDLLLLEAPENDSKNVKMKNHYF